MVGLGSWVHGKASMRRHTIAALGEVAGNADGGHVLGGVVPGAHHVTHAARG